MPQARDSVLLSDVQRIEATTPFIKEEIDVTKLPADALKQEQMLGSLTIKDI